MAEKKISRREFLRLSAITAAGLVLARCNLLRPSQKHPDGVMTVSTPPPDNKNYYLDSSFEPEAAFLSAATRYNPNVFRFVNDPTQRQILTSILLENQRVANGGFAARQAEAIASGNAIGVAICSDSRVCLGGVFPNLIYGKDLAIPVARIGAQPSIFQTGINHSFFIPHQTAGCVTGGCGALGGVEALVNNTNGITQLQHHGVSDMTIKDIQGLIRQGAGTTANTETIEEGWARVGAQMQAEINAQAHFGATGIKTPHFTAYGIYGHADDSLQMIGVVDNLGYSHPLQDLPILSSYSSYLSQPHPIIEALAESQSPTIININASRNFSTQNLLGEYANKPGVVFKSEADRIIGKALSIEDARKIVAGGDYGIGALKNGQFLLLTADNAQDMATLRTMVLTEGIKDGSIAKFLDEGGMIVEMIPDEAGRFTGTTNILTRETLQGDLKMIDLLESGRIGKQALLTDGIFGGQLINQATRDYELGIITKEQLIKIQTIVKAVEPITPFLKYGLQFAGDYLLIKDFHKWMTDVVLDEDLSFTAPSIENKNVFWADSTRILPTVEQNRIMSKNFGANPYLVSGLLDRVVVEQADLAKAHRGASAAYMKYGPGMKEERSPWKDMKSRDVGKLLELQIDPPFGIYDGQRLKLTTTLISKPNDEGFDGENIIYNDSDPNQRMMLVDQITGIPILGDVEGQKTIIPAFDPNNPNVTYLFEASSLPKERRFEFRFVGIVPVTQ